MMKSLIKRIVLLLGAALSLSACSNKVAFVYNSEVEVTTGDKISYSNFRRLDSYTDLIYIDGFKHTYKSYEDAMAYKDLLKEKSEAVYDQHNSYIGDSYAETISFFESLTPSLFDNQNLFISFSWSEMSYNVDSRRIEGVYLKGDTLYIHEYRDYLYKAASRAVHHLCYTFFISKQVNFVDVKCKVTDLFKY